MSDIDYSSPFFIVGAVRSGTTMLRLMLGHHPKICRCDEMEYLTPPIAELGKIPNDMAKYRKYLATEMSFRVAGYAIPEKTSYLETINDLFDQLIKKDGKPIFGGTVHHYYENMPLVWPKAKFVYLSRDPRNVARSSVKMGWAGTAWRGALIWIDAYESWQKLKGQLPAEQKIEVKFEELVADPEKVLSTICNFLAVEYTPEMLEIDKDTTYSKPSPRAAQSWLAASARKDVRQVEARVGARLMEAGYEASGLPPLNAGKLARTVMAMQDFFIRIRTGVKYYGLSLWVALIVARRTPNSDFAKRTFKKVQEIHMQRHK